MFQSIGRGWIFLKQTWLLGQKSPTVLLPTLVSILTTILTTIIILLPITSLVLYIRKNVLGQVAIGILIGMLLILLVGIIHVLSVMSANLIGAALSGQKPDTAMAWKKVSDLGGDLFIMGMGVPIYQIWIFFIKQFNKSDNSRRWEDASHLYIPVLGNEEVQFQKTPSRISQMQADNCVFTADGVGIKKIGLILIGVAMLIGLATGLVIGWLILTKGQDPGQARALAFVAVALLTAIFSLPVASYMKYAVTVFNTSLYLWGLSVREARKQGQTSPAVVPDPLAVALGIRPGR